mmetsp:Transcript_473/g.1160  ORF Transcript_473/g.1160 Transcript_473/m.1160 type:complete len:309 (-) Transcript_473:41-967(-)|eukprot:CAMPEP_0202351480 /NCGR_PEP_ID=MMETSP1126-20121109/8100_1 /ASSEMBLY_ACC=CAM_ASM_000457 /TAXON_ID=3047 /ORGANISM="Dunaliella tertiolecta, Strain CCMP1320" /LENGTH=308 /DNA_ID=CAMNT_0048943589 /DNA_START=192 /DNA_END=1118 /DNA_ORIENTATION=+
MAQTEVKGIKDGWFTELSPMWPGMGMSLKVEEVLFTGRSQFQDVCVFRSATFGNVLLLDGVIQATERDEFSYQEMITHLPLCALKTPAKKVLIVGGGDGGVLREMARYKSIEEIHMAEIDGMVPEVSKKYFPKMAVGFNDPRCQVHICDGIEFVRNAQESSYDAIIVDSSDPVGPAEVLFEKPFFEALHRAVRPGGIVCTQAESIWLHLDIIKSLAGMCASVFEGGSVSYAHTTIPTYPSGQIGMMLCVKAEPGHELMDPRQPRQQVPPCPDSVETPALRYYTPDVHRSAFSMPKFAADALESSLTFH